VERARGHFGRVCGKQANLDIRCSQQEDPAPTSPLPPPPPPIFIIPLIYSHFHPPHPQPRPLSKKTSPPLLHFSRQESLKSPFPRRRHLQRPVLPPPSRPPPPILLQPDQMCVEHIILRRLRRIRIAVLMPPWRRSDVAATTGQRRRLLMDDIRSPPCAPSPSKIRRRSGLSGRGERIVIYLHLRGRHGDGFPFNRTPHPSGPTQQCGRRWRLHGPLRRRRWRCLHPKQIPCQKCRGAVSWWGWRALP